MKNLRIAFLSALSSLAIKAQEEGCSICGDGLIVGFPDGVFAFSGQPVVACGLLEQVGFSGIIPLSECNALPLLVEGVCDCVPEARPTHPPFAPAMSPLRESPVTAATETSVTASPVMVVIEAPTTASVAPMMKTTQSPGTISPNTQGPGPIVTDPSVSPTTAIPTVDDSSAGCVGAWIATLFSVIAFLL